MSNLDQAFPSEEQIEFGAFDEAPKRLRQFAPGMSKREHFASLALQGILACPTEYAGHTTESHRAALAVRYADALIAKLAPSKEVV